ncbi:MAG: hypothetical protein L3K02_09170, partial [Thermoplasmata archaeon]|nr:hypothetical protein [Thermoplasmata archaeon]
LFGFFLGTVFLLPSLLTPGGPGLFPLVVFLPLFVVLVLVFGSAQSRQEARAVAAVRSGVILQRRRSELRVPWGQLQPGLIRPRAGMYLFQYILPGQQAGVGGFRVSVEQARAIIRSPFAPAWALSPFVAAGLGLPTSPGWGAVPPPAVPPPSGGYGAPAPPLLSSTPFAAGPPPPPPAANPWPNPSPPEWAPPPPAPAPRPRAPPGPPPGTVPCPRCGQFNPIGRVAFCQSCGQRLQ